MVPANYSIGQFKKIIQKETNDQKKVIVMDLEGF